MDRQQPDASYAHQTRAGHIILVPQRCIFCPHHAGKARDEHQAERDYNAVLIPRPYKADDQEGQQKARERSQRVVHPHQDIVCQAAEVPGHGADHRTRQGADGNCRKSNGKSGAGPFQNAAEDVASEIVGAEKVGKRRRLKAPVFHGRWRIGCPERTDQDSDQNDPGDD